MGKACCVPRCKNRCSKGNGLHFYRFPSRATEKDRRRAWIAAVNRKNWVPTQYSWVCSAHFVSG